MHRLHLLYSLKWSAPPLRRSSFPDSSVYRPPRNRPPRWMIPSSCHSSWPIAPPSLEDAIWTQHSCWRTSYLPFFVFCGRLGICYIYRTYYVWNLCLYTIIYTLSRPPAMAKGRPPTTMEHSTSANWGTRLSKWTTHFLVKLWSYRLLNDTTNDFKVT